LTECNTTQTNERQNPIHMKRSTLIIAMIGFGATLSAQDFNKFNFGFKVSPNISWMKPDEPKNMENVGRSLRFSYGLITDIHFTENYAFGTGLSVMSTGGKVRYFSHRTEDSLLYLVDQERTYNLRYVEIPLTLKMKTNEIGYITYWGQFGLGLGVNINGKADDVFTYKSQAEIRDTEGNLDPWVAATRGNMNQEDTNIKEDVQILRTALIFGAGIEYSISGNTRLTAGVLFNNGFSNVLKRTGIKAKDNGDPDLDGITNITQLTQKEFKLKSAANFIELQVGIMF